MSTKKKNEKKEEIIYFEVDNWFPGRDYPNVEPIATWVENNQFNDNKWCKENKLCVLAGYVDMSLCWCVAAPRSWVEKNCPDLLSDEILTYELSTTSKDGVKIRKFEYKATDFLCKPNEDGDVYGNVEDWLFPEYKEENFGVVWRPTENEDYEEENE